MECMSPLTRLSQPHSRLHPSAVLYARTPRKPIPLRGIASLRKKKRPCVVLMRILALHGELQRLPRTSKRAAKTQLVRLYVWNSKIAGRAKLWKLRQNDPALKALQVSPVGDPQRLPRHEKRTQSDPAVSPPQRKARPTAERVTLEHHSKPNWQLKSRRICRSPRRLADQPIMFPGTGVRSRRLRRTSRRSKEQAGKKGYSSDTRLQQHKRTESHWRLGTWKKALGTANHASQQGIR
mmetsp:Transcript_26920/g.104481  ORF Transcript_26920/g.104481 Transcript_26920/m.104481 type:complete len:237 (+) Transcript_26920:745-1455(+)